MTKKATFWPFARNTESVHEIRKCIVAMRSREFPIPLLQYLWFHTKNVRNVWRHVNSNNTLQNGRQKPALLQSEVALVAVYASRDARWDLLTWLMF